jgi:hypothetical protein
VGDLREANMDNEEQNFGEEVGWPTYKQWNVIFWCEMKKFGTYTRNLDSGTYTRRR